MNARTQDFRFIVEAQQVSEVVSCMFHTILFHRTLGKFLYTNDASYSIGTVGYTDVDCEYIDLTYVCCSSPSLDRAIRKKVNEFSESLAKSQRSGLSGRGQINLQFYQIKPNRWIFQPECTPWEIWRLFLEVIPLSTMADRQILREKLGESLTKKIFQVTEIMNKYDFVPKMPARNDLDQIFNISYEDVQPYLHNVNYSILGPPSGISVGSTMKKLFSDAFK